MTFAFENCAFSRKNMAVKVTFLINIFSFCSIVKVRLFLDNLRDSIGKDGIIWFGKPRKSIDKRR